MTDFTLTSPTSAIGAGTPSRAFSITTTGGTTGATTSFALSDGGAGGSFYPSSPSIAGSSASGTVTQFVYTPPYTATGNITITASASGGIVTSHNITLPVSNNASYFAQDTFGAAANTALVGQTALTGGTWQHDTTLNFAFLENGSNAIGTAATTGHSYDNPKLLTSTPQEHDLSCFVTNFDSSALNCPGLTTFMPGSGLGGYRFLCTQGGAGWLLLNQSTGSPVINGATDYLPSHGANFEVRLAIRLINSLQYIFAFANHVLLTGAPVQDAGLTSGYVGFIPEVPAGSTTVVGTNLISNFAGQIPNWSQIVTNSLSLSGPSSGVVSVASSNFTLTGINLTTSTICTPNDGGAGGTFSPTSLTLSGNGSGTFTYTPSTTGARTISITNNQGAVNPTPLSYTSTSSSGIYMMNNSSIFYAPDTHYFSGTTAMCPTPNGYMKFRVTNTTTVKINLTTSTNYPMLKAYYVQEGGGTYGNVLSPASFVQLSSGTTQYTVFSGLSTGTYYDVYIGYLQTGDPSVDNWGSNVLAVTYNSIQLDAGGTLTTSNYIRPYLAEVFGDSYLESYNGGSIYFSSQPNQAIIDYTQSWPFMLAAALNFEYGLVGIGSQGWIQPGNCNYPAFPTAWPKFNSSLSKTFNQNLDYVIVAQGTNDHGQSSSAVTTAVSNWITAARAAYGSKPKFIMVLNIAGIQTAAIEAGIAAANDSKTYTIDMSTGSTSEYQGAAFNGVGSSMMSTDGLHLYWSYQGLYGAKVAAALQNLTNRYTFS